MKFNLKLDYCIFMYVYMYSSNSIHTHTYLYTHLHLHPYTHTPTYKSTDNSTPKSTNPTYTPIQPHTYIRPLTLIHPYTLTRRLNHVFATLNVMVLIMIVVMACFFGSFSNWSLPPVVSDTAAAALNQSKAVIRGGKDTVNAGKGGFLPFGWHGVIEGYLLTSYLYLSFTLHPSLTLTLSLPILFSIYIILSLSP